MIIYAASAALLVGVALVSLLPLGMSAVYDALLIAAALLLTLPFVRARKVVVIACVMLIACALGMMRMSMTSELTVSALDSELGRSATFTGTIIDDPDERESTTMLHVALDEHPVRALVRAPAYVEVRYGDAITFSGRLALPESFDTDTGRVFDYPVYLAVSGIGYIVHDAKVEVLSTGHGNSIVAFLFGTKDAYLNGLSTALPEPHAALAGGITAGDKRSLGSDLLDNFRIAGIVHIVVLSGYNVTIIAETVLKMLAFLPLKLSLAVGALGIIGFALATGAGASIVRASIMAILALLARTLNRSYAIDRALVLAVVGMVLWNPYVLLFDVGFQLSVLATIGLVYVSPLIEEKLQFVPKKLGFREVAAATLGTQATVLPLLMWQMGNVSMVALPVNMLVLLVIPMAMLFSFFASLFGIFTPFLATLFGLPAYVLLSYVLWIVEASVHVPFAEIVVPPFSIWIMFALYAAFFTWLYLVYKKKTTGS